MNYEPIPALASAKQATTMIGRNEALARLWNALRNDPADRACRVAFIVGEGGLGKSRLLDEAWQRAPHADGGDSLNGAIVAAPLDMVDLQLHDRYRFVRALRDSLKAASPELDLGRFDRADSEVRACRGRGVRFEAIGRAEDKAITEFEADLAAITAIRRVAILVDTTEQWQRVTPRFIADQEARLNLSLLRPEDTRRAFDWLLQLLQEGPENITVVLAGREEARPLLDQVRSLAGRSAPVNFDDIAIDILSAAETVEYFAQLAREGAKATQPYRRAIAKQFRAVADDPDLCAVVHLLTGGVPVRLALYALVIIEGRTVPHALKRSLDATLRLALEDILPPALDNAPDETAETDDDDEPAEASKLDGDAPEETEEARAAAVAALIAAPTSYLRLMQDEVEEEFVHLIFSQRIELSARVLLALARTPLGLTAEQLHYELDHGGRSPADFMPDPQREEEIYRVLRDLESYYLGRGRRGAGVAAPAEPSIKTFRLALQDEIYTVFARHTGLLPEPALQEDMARAVAAAEGLRQLREDERAARGAMYRRLVAWADHQLAGRRHEKWSLLQQDERDLERQLDRQDIQTFQFGPLEGAEAQRRADIVEAISVLEIERMVYLILLDPENNLNAENITPEDDPANAGHVELDFWAQREMWRVLHEEAFVRFIDFHPRPRAKRRGETPLQVLHRFLEQEDAVRWIKRFVLRHEYERAIAYGQQLEKAIRAMPRGPRGELSPEANAYYSWNHTLAAGERAIWLCHARILSGDRPQQAMAALRKTIDRLEQFNWYATDEPLRGRGVYGETGFAAPQPPPPMGEAHYGAQHPASVRLRRVLSHACHWLANGERQLGQTRAAINNYGKALDYVRDDVGVMKAHRATVLNNLAHALSDLGLHGASVCLDGLKIRQELAEEVPLALSYQTLALIYDDLGRYEDGPLLAAKAIAYSRRADAKRPLAFALRQMAESLRHLAIRAHTGQRVNVTPDALYDIADKLLGEALELFEQMREPLQVAQTLIERGSLYRDRLQLGQSYYDDALATLREARQRVGRNPAYRMDIHINIAMAHLFAGQWNKCRAELERIVGWEFVAPYLVTPAAESRPADHPLAPANGAIYRHLSTVQMIRGRLALHDFEERVTFFKEKYPSVLIPDDTVRREYVREAVARDTGEKSAQESLKAAAEAYALGIYYAHQFSPRSRSISTLESDLYDGVKSFNHRELRSFHDHLRALVDRYPDQRRLIAELNDLIHDFTGSPRLELPTPR